MNDSGRYEVVPKDEFLPLRFFFSFDKRFTRVAPHWHDYIEIIYLLSGELGLSINTQQMFLQPGDMVIIGSNHIHSTMSNNLETSAYVLQISIKFLTSNSSKYSYILFDQVINSKTDSTGKLGYLKHLFQEFAEREWDNDEYSTLKRTSLLFDTLAVMTRYFSDSNIKPAEQLKHSVYEHLNIIIDYLSANYHRHITLDELAEQVGFTIHYLSRFFHKYVGMTITDYITMLRLDEAYNLVLNSKLSLLVIADQSGFANYPTFVKSFKNAYHMTPSKIREMKDKD